VPNSMRQAMLTVRAKDRTSARHFVKPDRPAAVPASAAICSRAGCHFPRPQRVTPTSADLNTARYIVPAARVVVRAARRTNSGLVAGEK
jgi:hypothetical protein